MTLSVLPGLSTVTPNWSLPGIDWPSHNTTSYQYGGPSEILSTGKEAAERRTVLPLLALAFNSSYSVQFFGPTLACQYAIRSQQLNFDYYAGRTMNQSGTVTYRQAVDIGNSGNLFQMSDYSGSASLLVYSAFTPSTDGFLYGNDFRLPAPAVNVWPPEQPSTSKSELNSDLQLWFQAANASIIGSLANASFDLDIQFLSGIQKVCQWNITTVNIWAPSTVAYEIGNAYIATFVALVNTLSLQPAYGTELDLHERQQRTEHSPIRLSRVFFLVQWIRAFGEPDGSWH